MDNLLGRSAGWRGARNLRVTILAIILVTVLAPVSMLSAEPAVAADGAWVQVGADIDGEAAGDWSGDAVAMSTDGQTVIIGAPNNDYRNGDGYAHVYRFDGTAWAQVGADIVGIRYGYGQVFGTIVAMSADGQTVIHRCQPLRNTGTPSPWSTGSMGRRGPGCMSSLNPMRWR